MERINYSELGEPVGPYSHGVKHNGALYLSGITAFGSNAQVSSIGDQALEIFRQIEIIAKTEGASLASIIKVTIFVTETESIQELREVLFKIYGPNLPASSLVQIGRLFSNDLKIEIEAILAVKNA